MIDFFDRLYASIRNKNKILSKLKFYSAQRLFVRIAANYFLPVYFSLTAKNKKYCLKADARSNARLIVTLTSFPKRIDKLWLVIECILRQSIKPDEIVLWLSKAQFYSKESLPKKLLNQQKRGLKIFFVDNDLRSHKKYYYTLQKFPDDVMITLDDDIFYPTNTIEELLYWNKIHPQTITARYGTKIKTENDELAPYRLWEEQFDNRLPSFCLFFGSGGGALFPPRSLPPETVNKEIFMNLCPLADDVWLNAVCRVNNRKVFLTHNELRSILPITRKGNVSLATDNYQGNQNDVQIKKVRAYFLQQYSIDPFKGTSSEVEVK